MVSLSLFHFQFDLLGLVLSFTKNFLKKTVGDNFELAVKSGASINRVRPGCVARARAQPFIPNTPCSFAVVRDRFLLFLCYVFVLFVLLVESMFTPGELCTLKPWNFATNRDIVFFLLFSLEMWNLGRWWVCITLLPSPPSFTPRGIEVQHLLSRPHVWASMPQLCYRVLCQTSTPVPVSHNPSLVVLTLKCPQVLSWSSAFKYFPFFFCFPQRVGRGSINLSVPLLSTLARHW